MECCLEPWEAAQSVLGLYVTLEANIIALDMHLLGANVHSLLQNLYVSRKNGKFPKKQTINILARYVIV